MNADKSVMVGGFGYRQATPNQTPHCLCSYRRSSAFIGGSKRLLPA
jgi:hypothetical protein